MVELNILYSILTIFAKYIAFNNLSILLRGFFKKDKASVNLSKIFNFSSSVLNSSSLIKISFEKLLQYFSIDSALVYSIFH